jgi:hypothetical protein
MSWNTAAQLQKLQYAGIDLEDLSSGFSIANLTLNDFRIDLAGGAALGQIVIQHGFYDTAWL